jgi:NADH-quinone oxidoreductase subunit C/D
LRARLNDHDGMVLTNEIFVAFAVGAGVFDTATALNWGTTGPGLRATGCA